MTYRVIQRFVDLQDNKHKYEVGDEFPHLDANVSELRIRELASDKNRRGIPLIEKVEDDFSEYMNPPEEPIDEEIQPAENRTKKKKHKKKEA